MMRLKVDDIPQQDMCSHDMMTDCFTLLDKKEILAVVFLFFYWIFLFSFFILGKGTNFSLVSP